MTTTGVYTANMQDNGWMKIYPLIGLASHSARYTGAWRVWSLARNIDRDGSGRVLHSDLREYLVDLGVNERTGRRWIKRAVEFGILKPFTFERSGQSVYFMASLENAAIALKAPEIGRAAWIEPKRLVIKGWKSYVWNAWLTTNQGLISQKTRHEITRVTPRTQRKYQRGKGKSIRNEVYLGKNLDPVTVEGLRQVKGWAVYTRKSDDGKVTFTYRRLPDTRTVRKDVARPHSSIGRSHKAQRRVNWNLCKVARVHRQSRRLFYEDFEQIEKTKARLSKLYVKDRPDMLFHRAKRDRKDSKPGLQNVNYGDHRIWEQVPLPEVNAL